MAIDLHAPMYLTYPSIERYGTHFTHLPLTQIRPPTHPHEPLALSRTPPSPAALLDSVDRNHGLQKHSKHSTTSSSNGTIHSPVSPSLVSQSVANIATPPTSHHHQQQQQQQQRSRSASPTTPPPAHSSSNGSSSNAYHHHHHHHGQHLVSSTSAAAVAAAAAAT